MAADTRRALIADSAIATLADHDEGRARTIARYELTLEAVRRPVPHQGRSA